MKVLAAVLLVVGFAAFGTAQTPDSMLVFRAGTVDGNTLSGGVEAVLPGVFELRADTVELRGVREIVLSGGAVIRLSPEINRMQIVDGSGRSFYRRVTRTF